MDTMTISGAALKAMQDFSNSNMRVDTVTPLGDDLFEIQVHDATLARLNRLRQPGEDDSAMLLRLFKFAEASERARSADGGHRALGSLPRRPL